MHKRTMGLLIGAVVLGALILGGAGMALAWGQSGVVPWNGTSGPMMDGQYHQGPMMGGQYRHGPMMGGAAGTTAQGTQGTQSTPAAGVTQVQMSNDAFTPATIQVSVGTTVTWTNLDSDPHTVTFRENALTSSGLLRQGDSYQYTFTAVGTFAYYCAVHPYMVGQVVVTP